MRGAWGWQVALVGLGALALGCGGDAAPAADSAVTADVVDSDVAAADTLDAEPLDTAPPAPPPIKINEFDCRADWVELVHSGAPGEAAAPLDALALADAVAPGGKRMSLVGELAPGERRVFALEGFGLACGDEGPVLWHAGAVLDAAPPGDAPDGFTFGRLPDTAGAFAVTLPTPGAPNRAPETDPFDPAAALFGYRRPVATVSLTLPETSLGSLWADPYTWVPATFAFFEPGADAPLRPPQPVAVRLKGRLGSLRDLSGKAAFKLDFARFWPGGEFHGLEEMTLNNMVQDYERVNEVLAYDLFRRMGVPTPRTAYVRVEVNGELFGVYLHLEALDKRWRDRHFPETLGFFEGAYGQDLFPGAAFAFDLDGGDEAARLALDALTAGLEAAPSEGFMDALAPHVDWDEAIAMMATEVFVGHWDGYGPTRNNYYLHVGADGRVGLVPWGLDQTFGDAIGLYDGQGLLLQGCVRDPGCRAKWDAALEQLAAIVRSPGYLGWADGLARHLQPHLDAEPREDAGEAQDGLDRAWGFLEARAEHVEGLLACWRDPEADADEDGYRCELDCDEGDASRHVGAEEICGDGVDQDCNGRIDDGADCPDCEPVALATGDYGFCWRDRTWLDAVAYCEGLGGHLVTFETVEEQGAVQVGLMARGFWTSWIGLSDLEEEGVFRWVTGEPHSDAAFGFADNQPDDWGSGEDCVQIYPDAGERAWNDLDCDAAIPAVCELPPTLPRRP